MSRSSSAIPQRAREIVDLAQAEIGFDEFVVGVLEVLERAIGFDSAFGARAELGAGVIAVHAEEELTEMAAETLRHATTRYANDILPVFAATLRDGGCLDSDFFPTERAKRESLYHREVLQPAKIRSMLQLCTRWRGRPTLRLNLNREGRRPFRQRHLEQALALLPTLEASVAARLAMEVRDSIPGLTGREIEISEFVARGLTTNQIACVLGTSPNTVRNQLSRIFEKLDIESRAELAFRVARVRGLQR